MSMETVRVLLEVRGAALTMTLRSALDALGLFDIRGEAGGFVATRRAALTAARRPCLTRPSTTPATHSGCGPPQPLFLNKSS